MRIGIDLDGVIIDNHTPWIAYYNSQVRKCHKERINTGLVVPSWGFFKNMCKRCWNYVLHHPDLILSYKPKEGVREILDWLKDQGIQMVLITSRPPDIEEITKEWVDRELPGIFEKVYVTQDKLAVCRKENLSLLLDDSPKNLEALQGTEVKGIIWDMAYNQKVKGTRVSTWYQFIKIALRDTPVAYLPLEPKTPVAWV